MTAWLAFGAATVALLLDAIRRFASTTAIELTPVLSAPVVALIVLLPFVLQPAVVAGLSRLPPRRALVLCAAAFVVAARVAPVIEETAAVIILAGIACLAGASLSVVLLCARPVGAHFLAPEAFALGLILDLGRRTTLGTLDLAELPGVAAPGAAGIEAAVFIALTALAMRAPLRWIPPAVSGPHTVVALPVTLVVAELAGTNGWLAAAAAGLGLSDGQGLRSTVTGTVAIACGLAAGALATGPALRPVGAVCLIAGALIAAARIPIVSLAGGALLATGLMICLRVIGSVPALRAPSPTRVAAAMTAGWIGFMAVTLAYWALYAFTPALWLAIALLAVVTLTSHGRSAAAAWPLRAGAATVLVLNLALLSAVQPSAGAGPGLAPIRLMTYNIHFGFDPRQLPSLDEIARTIEVESPDIVVLQEVMRGGSLAAQHDALGWLAGRLGMTYVFAPTIGDVFGNAVLTRLPVQEIQRIAFARPAPLRHSPRGALLVRMAGLNVVVTHLDEYVDPAGDAVREEELRMLLHEWGGLPQPVVIAGDLNAIPESVAITLLVSAGFRDLAAGSGPTFPALRPERRIDYVFGRGVGATATRVIRSRASDHLPVVADLMLAGR